LHGVGLQLSQAKTGTADQSDQVTDSSSVRLSQLFVLQHWECIAVTMKGAAVPGESCISSKSEVMVSNVFSAQTQVRLN
jgi:hypothetical protein